MLDQFCLIQYLLPSRWQKAEKKNKCKEIFNLLRLGRFFFHSLACQRFFLMFAQAVESVSALVSGSVLNGGGEIGLSHSLADWSPS